jgi:glycine/D-amino acid oxidase-like deaminating enzyme
MRARIAIVGGGVMGTSIALHAARRSDPLQEPVVLFEKTALAAGSSGRSGAILRQQYSDRELAAMARDSLREYASFYAKTGRWIGFRACGVLSVAGPGRPEFVELLRKNVAMQRSLGIDTHLIDAARMRALVPGIVVDERAVGAWEPGGGFVDPRLTVEAFAAVARASGATLQVGVGVSAVVVERGRVRGLVTTAGEVAAEQVVLAAGPWTRALLTGIGVDLPLVAVRPDQAFLSMPPGPEAPLEERPQAAAPPHEDADPRFRPTAADEPWPAHPVLLDLERNTYARCEPGRARTRVGKMDYEGSLPVVDPDDYGDAVTPGFEAWARAAIAGRLPVYAERERAGAEPALYTLTPDAQALIGPVPGIAGLWVVSGFSGHGFKLAPSIGEGVAQMLRGEPVSAFDAAFFAPTRFEGREGGRSKAFGL